MLAQKTENEKNPITEDREAHVLWKRKNKGRCLIARVNMVEKSVLGYLR